MPPRAGNKREVDPLLIKDGSASNLSDNDAYGETHQPLFRIYGKTARSNLTKVVGVVLVGCFIFLTTIVWSQSYGKKSAMTRGRNGVYYAVGPYAVISDPQSLVVLPTEEDGDYNVKYADGNETTVPATFGELGSIMLPPWYEATLISLDANIKPGMLPDDPHVKATRLVLRKTRDLLDIFSPIYPTMTLWKELRTFYKNGYELIGKFHDLSVTPSGTNIAGIEDYPDKLLQQRRRDVLGWYENFQRFQVSHDIRKFLSTKISKDGCYNHKESSHLFWKELEIATRGKDEQQDRQQQQQQQHHPTTLPCANDSIVSSLGELAVVQLNHSLQYVDLVMTYETAVAANHEINYHNLRKELRIFIDEYNLFGSYMINDTDNHGATDIISIAVKKLGDINDKWTAYDIIYGASSNDDAKHEKTEKRQHLEDDINQDWNEFKEWTKTNDLPGVLHSLVETFHLNNSD